MLSMSLRLVYLISGWTSFKFIFTVDLVQQVAKLCVGVVQDWITLELAIRIRNSKGDSDISEAAERKLRRMSFVLIVIITLSFVSFAVTGIVSAHKQGSDGFSFPDNICSVYKAIGYGFLI